LSTTRWVAPQKFDRAKTLAKLEKKFKLETEPNHTARESYFDTFDWRLFNQGLALCHSQDVCDLRSLEQAQIMARGACKKPPRFVWDMAPGALRSAMEPIVEMRALLPRATIKRRRRLFRLIDDERKTLARIVWDDVSVKLDKDWRHLPSRVETASLRGYEAEAESLIAWLAEVGFEPAAEDAALEAMRAAGCEPGGYSSKIKLDLNPGMTGGQAMREILVHLFDTMKANIDGVINDVDTEFLHDYRVAIRRIRSAISQIKKTLEPDVKTQAKEDFAWLGKSTNRLRDIDVYLLDRGLYHAMLPEDMSADIEPFFAYLAKERQKERRKLVKLMKSKTFADALARLEALLRQPPAESEEAPRAAAPALVLAQKTIYAKYKDVITDGEAIGHQSPDEALHALRVDCKKLRYLMEFFQSLFPAKKIVRLIKQLKKLQELLGDYNDYYMQQLELRAYAGRLSVKEPRAPEILLTVGVLIGKLSAAQQDRRDHFAETFAEFASADNRAKFKELFLPRKAEKP